MFIILFLFKSKVDILFMLNSPSISIFSILLCPKYNFFIIFLISFSVKFILDNLPSYNLPSIIISFISLLFKSKCFNLLKQTLFLMHISFTSLKDKSDILILYFQMVINQWYYYRTNLIHSNYIKLCYLMMHDI